jgi:hypothetical protein
MNHTLRPLTMALLMWSLSSTGCVMTPDPYYEGDLAPPLPAVVEMDSGPYYYYRDYHYRYDHDRWHYARHREGPWKELPRSHWPREVRRSGTPGLERSSVGHGPGGDLGHGQGDLGHGPGAGGWRHER